jgi:hypothetical protein
MAYQMNELPDGFEDLPIGFIQALFEFYRTMENQNPDYNIGDIAINRIEPSMRSAIIRGDYIAYEKPDAIRPSDIYNFGIKIGLSKKKVMDIIAGKYDGEGR